MAKNTLTVEQILTRHVRTKSGCWEWTGGGNQYGYGQAMVTLAPGVYRVRTVHRMSYELHHGPVPEGHVVMHTCDNRGCINPDHLRVGTQAENLADARRKGRMHSVPQPPPPPSPLRKPYSPPTFRPITFKESLALQVIARRSGGVHR